MSGRRNSGLFLAMAAALAHGADVQDPRNAQPPAPSGAVVPLQYVGSNARVAASVDEDGRIAGEVLGIFGHDGKRAFLAQSWLGDGGAGGVQLDYHRLVGTNVIKLFGALDQNRNEDRKGTLGLGFERAAFGLDLYYSHALTDERLISQDLDSSTETLFRVVDGLAFEQDITIDTLTERFEHPYEHGLGFRVSRIIEPALLRLRAGLDYERGEALLLGDSADQLNVMVGLEKYFRGTGHSVALEVEHFRKDGPFDRAAFGGERDGTRAAVSWRYEFGRPFRPAQVYRMVPVQRTQTIEREIPTVIRNELQLSGKTLFAYNAAVLTETGRTELQPLLDRLKHDRVGFVEIVGHTCDLGSDAYNQALSERRAAAVRDWLIAEGVDPQALLASGEGEQHPRYPNDSEENRARNRRIELRFATVEEKTVAAPESQSTTITEWVREAVPQSPAWIDGALRTPAFHKRAVDTYRIQRVTQTRTEGPLVPINQAPTAANDTGQTTQGTAVIIDVLANDNDADGDALVVTAVTDPASGSARVTADGTISYAPDADFLGTETFTYTVEDGNGGSATATVTVTVTAATPVNNPPNAEDDSVVMVSGGRQDLDLLANDSDPDGDAFTITAVTQPAQGAVLIINAGDMGVRYVADPGASGTDSFTYTITDEGGLTDTATVAITLEPQPNRSPLARDDTVSTPNGQPVDIPVLANDRDPELDVLSIIAIGVAANGTVSKSGDILTYTPNPGFADIDSFFYTITDGNGGEATATVTVTVFQVD